MVKECKTSTYTKSKKVLRAEFEKFRLNMSSYTPLSRASIESGHNSYFEINEQSRGQLDKGKKRALEVTKEEGSVTQFTQEEVASVRRTK